ncbi:hypothetical protein [Mycolicibacter virginiensis]|uniref:hypothetical protein n=1 Tax=Mycolicibacter virginiensis TaxID=1795032 RepID=UPI001F04BF8E|nr:hypothetical protein [Mycolicibacter virginiensis]ULP45881.1 hypothetical protein MJO54_13480 [Mycolicibacter virginiensis]
MGRRPSPTPSNVSYASETVPAVARTLVTTYAQALQPLNMIAQSAVGETRWDAVAAAVVALRSARESMSTVERRLLGLAVLSGGPIGEIAALMGIAPSTLSAQLVGTDAQLLGQALSRDVAGQWVIEQ